MNKREMTALGERNGAIERIIGVFTEKDRFLVLGHAAPDEDCIAAMVAVALILSKLGKSTAICLSDAIQRHYKYLLNICRYNSIYVLNPFANSLGVFDVVVVCDTPKASMIEPQGLVERLAGPGRVPIVEIDHHIGEGSEYIGDEGLRLVTDASSTSELLCHLAFKLGKKRELLRSFQIGDLFSRNLALAILTGMIGDTNMGQYLKSERERRYYVFFTNMLNRILIEKTVKVTNLQNKEEIFAEIQRHSSTEERCFDFIMKKKRFSPSVGFVLLSNRDFQYLGGVCDKDTFVSVTRAAANSLAEESGRFGLVAYAEGDAESSLVQFRLRRSYLYHEYDLRAALALFSITNGGGHEGAIGFRFPRGEVGDIEGCLARIVEGLEKAVAAV